MSNYREPEPRRPHYASTDEIYTIKKLLETKKLTDKQKAAIQSLLHEYYNAD